MRRSSVGLTESTAQKEEEVKAFLEAYPQKRRRDAYFVDTMIRPPLKHIMENKAALGGAPVYSYIFAWDSSVMGGVFHSYHTAEIPYSVLNRRGLPDAFYGGFFALRAFYVGVKLPLITSLIHRQRS